ncbi:MAG TPA: DUF302 domain-containing protein [Vulgatibacter sp.]|nr:DUF302 domain-containing protein [Vulgatibacter sp.]
MKSDIGMRKTLDCTFDEALTKVPEALKTEGFGILTQIDLAGTLKEKIGVDFRRSRILGACNPKLAHEALQMDLGVGVIIPCNVALFETDDGKVEVIVVDPMQTPAASGGDALRRFAGGVREKLERVLRAL